MTAQDKDTMSFVKQPFFVAIVLVIVAVAILIVAQEPQKNDEQAMASNESNEAATPGDINLKPPTTAGAGQNTPKIVQSMAGAQQQQGQQGQVSAPGLESLVAGLEKKVEADPSLSNRLLLAQTYNELGMQDKALAGMRELQKEHPDNGRVNLILSSMLSRSNDEAKLKESLTLLDKLSGDKTVQQYLVELYKGDALIRVQDHDGALKHWKLALEKMPEADNRRAILEKRIADLSTKGSNTGGSTGG